MFIAEKVNKKIAIKNEIKKGLIKFILKVLKIMKKYIIEIK